MQVSCTEYCAVLCCIRCKKLVQEKLLYKKPCQTVKFLVQVDLYKFLVQVSWLCVTTITVASHAQVRTVAASIWVRFVVCVCFHIQSGGLDDSFLQRTGPDTFVLYVSIALNSSCNYCVDLHCAVVVWTILWLGGVVVSALSMKTRRPRFE